MSNRRFETSSPRLAGPSPTQAGDPALVGRAVSTYDNGDQSHIFTWYPEPQHRRQGLPAVDDGRPLPLHARQAPLFLTEVGLQRVPPEQWRNTLGETLAALPPLGGDHPKYPWGNELLIAANTGLSAEQVVLDCERKPRIDRAIVIVTTSGAAIAAWTRTALLAAGVELGYRFVNVTRKTGGHGPYATVTVTREPE